MMYENSDIPEQDNIQTSSSETTEGAQHPTGDQNPTESLFKEHEHSQISTTDASPTSLVPIFVADEGLEEAGTLLKAWVPDIPLSIIVVTSNEAQVSYLKDQLEPLDTFVLTIPSTATEITAGHIYILLPGTSYRFHGTTLAVNEEVQTEQIPGESFLSSYARLQKQSALFLFFVKSIADYASIVKLLSSCHSSIIHHSPVWATDTRPEEESIRHLVDRSSSLEEVAVYTQRFIESFSLNFISELEHNPQSTSYVQHITSILADHTSSTFTHIKPGYILLHVYQRLRVHGFTSIHQYIEKLASSPEEISLLAKRVTLKNVFFFNDLRSLRIIAKTVIPSLVKEADHNRVIRVWVPGCSSGEDVLSLSMLIHEHADSVQTSTKVRLVGSEGNDRILQFARKPQYSQLGLSSIPNILKEKFFKIQEDIHEFDPAYLAQCSYSALHLTMESPLDNVDIIYCKDLLPFLTNKAKKTVLQRFKEALSPKGILVLGSGETNHGDLPFFAPVKNQPFIYRPIQTTIKDSSKGQDIKLLNGQEEAPNKALFAQEQHSDTLIGNDLADAKEQDDIHTLHRDLLLQIQAPVSVMIRSDFSIVDHIGNVGRFIAWPNNGHTQNMLEAFPKEVQEDLRFAVNQVLKSKIALKSRPLKTEYEGIFREFRLQVHPINLDDSENNLIQVIFLETESSVSKNTPLSSPKSAAQDDELAQLKSELEETQEKLKVVSGLLKDSKELLRESRTREKEARNSAPKINLSEEHEKIARQNQELRSTNTELLELNRDLVRRIEELRRNMNRKLKEMEQASAKQEAEKKTDGASSLTKNLELILPKRHEVRTSLTSIIGFADLLADRIVDKDNRELAKYIGKSGHRLSENLAPILNMDFQDSDADDVDHGHEIVLDDDIVSSNRVLVVEDSEATRRLLTLVLSDRFECEVAADGSEAIEKAEKEIFKAVLLDIDLGKGPNGIDVLDHLRQKNYYRTVPFMAVTSMATPQDRSMLLRKGFDAFVPKPFQKVQLLSTLDKIIDNSGTIA